MALTPGRVKATPLGSRPDSQQPEVLQLPGLRWLFEPGLQAGRPHRREAFGTETKRKRERFA